MILAHLRLRRRVSLLAAGVLEGRERSETLAHVEACARCRAEHEALRAVVPAIEADPVREAEPGVPLAFLVARVEREVERALAPAGRPRWWLVALPAAAAILAAVALVPRLVSPLRPAPEAARAAIPPAEASPLVTEDALARIERNLAREHAVRYLSEAGEVLVTVAATGADCDPAEERLDVGPRPRAQPRAARAPRPRGRRRRRGGGERTGRPRRRRADAAGGGGPALLREARATWSGSAARWTRGSCSCASD